MNRIKNLREEKGVFQKDLAKLLSVSIPAINYYENEKRAMDTKTASILADYFNVSIDYLLGKSDIRNIAEEFEFAYHKDTEGLSDEDIKEALRIYKEIKKNIAKNEEKK